MFYLVLCLKLALSPWATGDFANGMGQKLNYGCDAVILLVVLIQFRQFPKSYFLTALVAGLTGVSYAMATLIYTSESVVGALTSHLRIYLPLLAIPAMHSVIKQARVDVYRWNLLLCVGVSLLIIVAIIGFPPSVNRLKLWQPSYFGHIHTSAYVAMMAATLVLWLSRRQRINPWLAVPWFSALAIMIALGWGVRTVALAMTVILLGWGLSRVRLYRRSLLAWLLPLLPALAMIVIVWLSHNVQLDNLTSGRLSMYVAKGEQLMANTMPQWFIGNGYRSDLIITDIWWWEAKGAHSDVITFLVEGGLLYLGGFLVVFNQLYRLHHRFEERLLLVALLVTSLFSNGIFVRPLPAYFLCVLLGMNLLPRRPTRA